MDIKPRSNANKKPAHRCRWTGGKSLRNCRGRRQRGSAGTRRQCGQPARWPAQRRAAGNLHAENWLWGDSCRLRRSFVAGVGGVGVTGRDNRSVQLIKLDRSHSSRSLASSAFYVRDRRHREPDELADLRKAHAFGVKVVYAGLPSNFRIHASVIRVPVVLCNAYPLRRYIINGRSERPRRLPEIASALGVDVRWLPGYIRNQTTH